MDRTNNAALLELSTIWKLTGDWMQCRGCGAALVASRDGEALRHDHAACRFIKHVHPWADLRSALDAKGDTHG